MLVPAPLAVPRCSWGPAGPLLRPLADADPADPVPAGGVRSRLCGGRGAGEARAPARRCRGAAPAGWPAAIGRAGGRSRCSLRASSTASTPASCSPRADTRTLTRDWMLAHMPPGARVVVEPVSPDDWAREAPGAAPAPAPATLVQVAVAVHVHRPERRARPARTHQVGHRGLRAHARPGADRLLRAPRLLLGRDRLDRVRPRARGPARPCRWRSPTTGRWPNRAKSRYRASPYAAGSGPVPFNFDWSFDYYPLAYERPGPR